jgi:prepilin-type N-terminal cleavage/methylation domain-containing protein
MRTIVMQKTMRKRRGFSLVELVIVIVIIGIIAAIAVPRLSRGAKSARDGALRTDLTVMRNAIDLYTVEHGDNFPTAANFADQMTRFSDLAGTSFSDTLDAANDIIYGPYIKAVPGLPVEGTGITGGAIGDTGVAALDGAGVGWLYTEGTGVIKANTGTSADDEGTNYADY